MDRWVPERDMAPCKELLALFWGRNTKTELYRRRARYIRGWSIVMEVDPPTFLFSCDEIANDNGVEVVVDLGDELDEEALRNHERKADVDEEARRMLMLLDTPFDNHTSNQAAGDGPASTSGVAAASPPPVPIKQEPADITLSTPINESNEVVYIKSDKEEDEEAWSALRATSSKPPDERQRRMKRDRRARDEAAAIRREMDEVPSSVVKPELTNDSLDDALFFLDTRADPEDMLRAEQDALEALSNSSDEEMAAASAAVSNARQSEDIHVANTGPTVDDDLFGGASNISGLNAYRIPKRAGGRHVPGEGSGILTECPAVYSC